MFCYLCAINPAVEYFDTLDCYYENCSASSMIERYFQIETKPNSSICADCWQQLQSFQSFVKKVQEAQELVEVFIKEEISDNKNDDAIQNAINDYEHLENNDEELTQVQIKREEEFTASTPTTPVQEIESEYDNLTKSHNKRRLSKRASNRIKKNELSTTNIEINVDIKTEKSEEEFKKLNYNPEQDEDEKIANFMDLICLICSEKFPTYSDFKRHCSTIHKISGYINCCDLKFYSRTELTDHIEWKHYGSDLMKCHVCGKKLSNTRSLKRHMVTFHNWKKDELFPCNLCQNVSFSRRMDLKKHKFDTHTPGLKCSKCKKFFKNEGTLKTHKETKHYRKTPQAMVCDLCGQVFKSASGFHKHTTEIHERKIKPRQDCDICGSLVKNMNYHKKMAHPPEGTIIQCPICNKTLPTFFALKSHKANVHIIDKRKFLCNLCDKGFKNAKILLEHTASHTGQPLYTCPYCLTTFKYESNYLKHKKRLHRPEWAEEKRLKYLSLKSS